MPTCTVCRQPVAAWKPHPNQHTRSAFMQRMQTVGSDLAVFECPSCGCTDRDRHLWLYLQAMGMPAQLRGARVLHLAPEARLEPLIEACGPAEYVRGDLHPQRPHHQRLDAQALPFADGAFDLIICNHVLEHVHQPAAVLREFRRVLADGGMLIAQTPYSPLLKHTFELTELPDAEFAALFFGQNDHVRLFGEDIASHFHEAGFAGQLYPHAALLPDVDAAQAGINPLEPLFAFHRNAAVAA